jgi:anti-sigma B factor antagonist
MAASEPGPTNGALNVRTEPRGKALVVRASGEIDIASAKSLEKEIQSAFDHDGDGVFLDLEDVTYIDSTGLAVLLRAQKVSTANGHKLRITRLSSSVEEAINVTGLDGAFPLVE